MDGLSVIKQMVSCGYIDSDVVVLDTSFGATVSSTGDSVDIFIPDDDETNILIDFDLPSRCENPLSFNIETKAINTDNVEEIVESLFSIYNSLHTLFGEDGNVEVLVSVDNIGAITVALNQTIKGAPDKRIVVSTVRYSEEVLLFIYDREERTMFEMDRIAIDQPNSSISEILDRCTNRGLELSTSYCLSKYEAVN